MVESDGWKVNLLSFDSVNGLFDSWSKWIKCWNDFCEKGYFVRIDLSLI